jgi:hypothetical protein
VAVALEREDGDVYRLEISGRLRKADLDRAQEEIVAGLRQAGLTTIRLLVTLHGFEGWEPGAAWNDLTFYVRHGDAIARIAIVGPPEWQHEALMFAAADLRKGPVEYFQSEIDARAWLAG